MSEDRSGYARADLEWYQEPPWVSERLLDAERFDGGAQDTACGVGAIPDVLASRGRPFTGADIVDRAQGKFALRDFLIPIPSPAWPNIICNPPASKLPFVEQALAQVEPGGLMAVLAPLKWAGSQGRYALFSAPRRSGWWFLAAAPHALLALFYKPRARASVGAAQSISLGTCGASAKLMPAPASGGSSENSSVREVVAPRKGSASPGRLRVSEKVYDYE